MSSSKTLLESFPTEVFSLLSEYVLFGDILALYQCGSSTVCAKLLQSRMEIINLTSSDLDPYQGWHTIDIDRSPDYFSPGTFKPKFSRHRNPPPLPSLLKSIKHIRVLKMAGRPAPPDLTGIETLLPWATTLTRLDLVAHDGTSFLQQQELRKTTGRIFYEGFSILTDAAPELVWAPLKDLFPLLTSFSLVSEEPLEINGRQFEDFFKVLPPNLTVLKMRPFLTEPKPEHLRHLPTSLTQYELLTTSYQYLNPDMLNALHPSVVHLSICSANPRVLPSSSHLRTLELQRSHCYDFTLPDALESLIIHHNSQQLGAGGFIRAPATAIVAWPQTLTILSLPPDSPPLSASLFTQVPPHLTALHCHSFETTPTLGTHDILLKLPTCLTDLRVTNMVWPSLSKTAHPLRKYFSGKLLSNLRILNIPLEVVIQPSTFQEDLPSIHSLTLPNGIISETALLKLPRYLKFFKIRSVDAEGRFLYRSAVPFGILSLAIVQKSLMDFTTTWKSEKSTGACLLDGTRIADINWSSSYSFEYVTCTELKYCPDSQVEQMTGTWTTSIPPERLPKTLKVIQGPYSLHWNDMHKLPRGISFTAKVQVELGDEQVHSAIKAGYRMPPLYCHPPIIPPSFFGEVHFSASRISFSFPLTDAILAILDPNTAHLTNITLEFGKVTEKGLDHIPTSIKRLEIKCADNDGLLEALYHRLSSFGQLNSLTIPAHSRLQNAGFDLIPPTLTSLTILENQSQESIEINGEHLQYLRPPLTTLSILAPCDFKDDHAKFIMASVANLKINSDKLTEAVLQNLPASVKTLTLSSAPNSHSIYEKFKVSRKPVFGTKTALPALR